MARNGKFGFDLSERAISLFMGATDMPDVLQELAFDRVLIGENKTVYAAARISA